jgi:hypothetical protein
MRIRTWWWYPYHTILYQNSTNRCTVTMGKKSHSLGTLLKVFRLRSFVCLLNTEGMETQHCLDYPITGCSNTGRQSTRTLWRRVRQIFCGQPHGRKFPCKSVWISHQPVSNYWKHVQNEIQYLPNNEVTIYVIIWRWRALVSIIRCSRGECCGWNM